MDNLLELERRLAGYDAQLRPIAKRPVDIRATDWQAKLLARPHPLDETGLRTEMQTLLTEITDLYARCAAATRQAIRTLFDRYDSVSWAAAPPWPATTADGFRRQLLLFSILDQGRDTRDAILWLHDIAAKARAAGVHAPPILEEVAALSSDVNKFGMGSTKGLLLNASKAGRTA